MNEEKMIEIKILNMAKLPKNGGDVAEFAKTL